MLRSGVVAILSTTLFLGASFSPALSPPSFAAVAPLADVGLREFLVKESNALLRLSLPSSMTSESPMDLANDPGRQAQEAVELVKLRLEQVGFSGKPAVWSACLKEVNAANAVVTSDSFLKFVPSAKIKRARELTEEADKSLEELRDAIRREDIKGTLAAQERAAEQIYQVRKVRDKVGHKRTKSILTPYKNRPSGAARHEARPALRDPVGILVLSPPRWARHRQDGGR